MKALVRSDIHGHLPVLQAVLLAEPDANQIICLGDLVNYGPHPVECVAWAMGHPTSLVVEGNEDRAFGLGKTPNCSPVYQRMAEAVQAATSALLNAKMRGSLAKLPASRRFCLGGATCVACHSTGNNKGPIPAPQRCSHLHQCGIHGHPCRLRYARSPKNVRFRKAET